MNEAQGMVLKAARGAGLPLGHAEDLAAAIPFLAGASDPGAALAEVLDCLAAPADPATFAAQAPLTLAPGNTAMTMPAAIDAVLAGLGPVHLPPPHSGLCCAMVSAAIALTGTPMVLTENTLALGTPGGPPPRAAAGPVDVPGETWAALDAYARRTYVPETEASRQKGAGAGLTDND